MSCWNVGTTGSWSPWKEVPGSKRLVTRQVKRLVLSGVIPTIQQQRELFLAFHTLSIRKSDKVKKFQCHKEIIENIYLSAIQNNYLLDRIGPCCVGNGRRILHYVCRQIAHIVRDGTWIRLGLGAARNARSRHKTGLTL